MFMKWLTQIDFLVLLQVDDQMSSFVTIREQVCNLISNPIFIKFENMLNWARNVEALADIFI